MGVTVTTNNCTFLSFTLCVTDDCGSSSSCADVDISHTFLWYGVGDLSLGAGGLRTVNSDSWGGCSCSSSS